MAENKTKPTGVSVASYIDGIEDATRRKDCKDLSKLMTKVTKQPGKMWGTSIVGFGSYHYKYASGHEGDSCLTGFSSRAGNISVYLMPGAPGQKQLLDKLGKHKMGKGCLYIRTLADVDLGVLEKLVRTSVAAHKKQA